MKNNNETTKNKSYSSSTIRNLSMNKEQNPKHKPISKAQIYAKNQREKHKIKYKRVQNWKPIPVTWRFWATSMQQWRLEMGARSVWEGEDEQSQIFEGKLKKI